MKKITLSILAFFVLIMSVSGRSFTEEVCHGNVTFSSQAEVDAVTCTQVDGRLNISGPDIHNIVKSFGNGTGYLTNRIVAAALPSAISCEGDVILTSQAEVDAFHCTEVGRFLRITGNDITNLDALSSLKKVGALVIENNPNLRNVDGLSALSKTGVQDRSASFSISNNPMLTNLDGFQSLDSVGGNIIIYGNESLTSINGFPMLKKAHSISITNNAALVSIDGFNNVTEMYSYSAGAIYHPVELRIEENFSLERVNGFSSLKSLSGTGGAFLYINNNDALTGFNGLSSLQEIGTIWKDAGLFINNNKLLKNLNGLASLDGLRWGILTAPKGTGIISISNNAALENVDALGHVVFRNEYISTFSLKVTDNPSLGRCCGLFGLLKIVEEEGFTNVDISENGADCSVNKILIGGACTPQVCEGNIILTSQAEVDAFQCNKIIGSLTISGGDIINIEGLSSLKTIGGTLTIENNPMLTNLNGLFSLDSITGTLIIKENNSLASINGFGELVSVGGTVPYAVTISSNPSLAEVNGFSALESIQGISIKNNAALVSVSGFSKLVIDYGILEITSNNSLIDINGFKNLKEIRPAIASAVIIDNNAALQNLDGLTSLEIIEGPNVALRITNNPSLSNIDGLFALTSILTTRGGASLEVENNDALKNIDGLSSFSKIKWDIAGSVIIRGNELLENVDGLSSLTFDGNSIIDLFKLIVTQNPSLARCCGLFPFLKSVDEGTLAELNISENGAACTVNDILIGGACGQKVCEGDITLTSQAEVNAFNCFEIVGRLIISGNDITNVDALSSLRSVRFGGLVIENNPNLQNLDGLSSLTDVGGFVAIRIANNPSLHEINGFSALVSAAPGGIFIENNNSLTNIRGFNALNKIGSNVYSVMIVDNPSLVGIDGFTSADTIGGIVIKNNNALADINGFSNLTTVYGLVEVANNNSLASLKGFQKVTYVTTGSVEPAVFIEHNVSLENLDGFSSLKIIEGRGAQLRIVNNAALTNINGLSSLTTILGGGRGAGFVIENNDALKNLSGLQSLATFEWGIAGSLVISGNDLLENIDGLSSLRYRGTTGILELLTIRVKDNPSLIKCCGLFPWFKSIGASRIADIRELDFSGNGGGCTLEDILACEGQSISDFSIFDRGFDDNVSTSVNDTLTIDVANSRFPYLVLRANTLPTHVGSVEFRFDNSITHVENVFPYHFEFPVMELGTHRVVTNVYSGANKTGERGNKRTLTLIVVNTAAISSFDVVNTSGQYLMQLTEDSRINIKNPAFRSVSIRANTFPDPVTSVKFWLNGQFFRVENIPPYAFNGDINGIYNPWVVNPWDYTIKAIPYIRIRGKEYAGTPLEVHFKVVSENVNYAVVGYDIVDTSGNFIGHLNEGDVISNDQPMTIIANTTGQVGSVKFTLNNQFYRTENVPPYTITGDQNGYFNPWVPQAGNYTLTGTPYSASSAGGNAGSSRTIHFKVVNKKTNNESTARVIPGNTESNPSKNESSVLTLYPVPVDDQLNVVIESASLENISIAILNVYGLVVYKDTYKGPSAVDTSNLRSGVYFLQVVGAEGYQEVKKFIKN
ncbi:T9SS type A sorting domain-containing protein [Chryseolinea sp. H1M3-3]|uniref:T9SS type A sorting domain-containing protein n=1 Tax=Chryseolinea sp. H1M3-3 TaxID=3034144 RepID=UPI0023ED103B|nr:T9SS type A sorting domain-containing protein [Chryseolinea sp. H1M3-3]